MTGHHPVFEHFECTPPFDDDRFHHNFMGAKIAHAFETDLSDIPAWADSPLAAGLKASGRCTRYEDGIYPFRQSEDYFEWIDLLVAIERARSCFRMIEIGAGYGRWTANAAAALRRRKRPRTEQQHFIALEASTARYESMIENCRYNSIAQDDVTLICAACVADDHPALMVCDDDYGAGVFRNDALLSQPNQRFSASRPDGQSVAVEKVPARQLRDLVTEPVDFLDMDIQGAELEVIPSSIDTLDRFVKMIHIGTHSPTIDARLPDIFRAHGWHPRHQFLSGCVNETPYGAFHFIDGIQSWENPRLSAPPGDMK